MAQFGGGETNVWTDIMVQPHLGDPAVFTPEADSTFILLFSTNGQVVVYDGATPTTLTNIVSEDTWVRVTVKSDYAAKTWDLYLDSQLAAPGLDFYNGGVSEFTEFGVLGGGLHGNPLDNIGVLENRERVRAVLQNGTFVKNALPDSHTVIRTG